MFYSRKRTICLSLLTGACIIGIPLLVLLCIQQDRNRSLSNAVARYEKTESNCQTVPAYVLTRNLSAGDQITAECYTRCIISADNRLSLNLVTEPGRLENCHARIALHKGSILIADMFYSDISKAVAATEPKIYDISQ